MYTLKDLSSLRRTNKGVNGGIGYWWIIPTEGMVREALIKVFKGYGRDSQEGVRLTLQWSDQWSRFLKSFWLHHFPLPWRMQKIARRVPSIALHSQGTLFSTALPSHIFCFPLWSLTRCFLWVTIALSFFRVGPFPVHILEVREKERARGVWS